MGFNKYCVKILVMAAPNPQPNTWINTWSCHPWEALPWGWVAFWVIILLYPQYICSIWLNPCRTYSQVHLKIPPKTLPLHHKSSYRYRHYLHRVWRGHGMFLIISCYFSSPYFSFPFIMVQFHLGFICGFLLFWYIPKLLMWTLQMFLLTLW